MTLSKSNQKSHFRTIDTFRLVRTLTNQEQIAEFVHIKGVRCLGKSSMAKEAMEWLEERRYFSGGMVYLDLRDLKFTS